MPKARLPLQTLTVLCALAGASSAFASFDEFSDERVPPRFRLTGDGVSLAIKGELELGLHDIEGSGGPGHDSPTDTRTLGTRSPHANIDSFWLALRLGLAETIGVNSILELTTRDARVGAVWLDYRPRTGDDLRHHVQLGYGTPIVAIDRRTERYPLTGTSYWRQPELHLAYEVALAFASRLQLEAGASLAVMRPLGFAGVQQSSAASGTINLLSYDPAGTFSGNGPVGGGRLALDWSGAFVEGFGFLGRLAAQGGTDSLRSGFPTYRNLPGYTGGENSYGDFWWAGTRAGFRGKRLQAFAEAITSREDLLRRWGAYGQVSYRLVLDEQRDWLRAVEPVLRYEGYRILHSTSVHEGTALRSTAVINAVSWDWNVFTAALITQAWRDLLWLRIEYYAIREKNGVPALGIADEPFPNDELLVQVALRF